MRKKIAALLFAAVLSLGAAACVNETEKGYEAKLEYWIGKSEKELVTAWGIPDKQYQVDANTRMLSYMARNTVVYPGTFGTCYGYGSRFHTGGCVGGFPPSAQTFSCETLFTLTDGRVTKWGHRGNDCVAKERPK